MKVSEFKALLSEIKENRRNYLTNRLYNGGLTPIEWEAYVEHYPKLKRSL